jgi:hypothetical protein
MSKMGPQVIKFLRKEAHKFYMQLGVSGRSMTTEQAIYRGLKASWRAGSKLTREAREKGLGMPMNYKQVTPEQRAELLAADVGKGEAC